MYICLPVCLLSVPLPQGGGGGWGWVDSFSRHLRIFSHAVFFINTPAIETVEMVLNILVYAKLGMRSSSANGITFKIYIYRLYVRYLCVKD